jgi:hypothetical protein
MRLKSSKEEASAASLSTHLRDVGVWKERNQKIFKSGAKSANEKSKRKLGSDS